MKGNVFSQWLREFCALVFTQTVQAFLLAIVLTLIVVVLVGDTPYGSVTTNQAAGMLAIIALASISKLEDLIKKLFGIQSSLTDTSMKSGTHGMMGTIMAMKMAKKAFDNIPKIGSGIRDRVNIGREKKAAELSYKQSKNRELSRYNQLHGNQDAGNVNGTVNVNANNNGANVQGGTGTATAINGVAGNTAAASGQLNGGSVSVDNLSINSNNANVNADNVNGNNGDAKNKNLKAKFDMEDKLEKIEQDYKTKIQELNKKKRDANRKIASGITETGGAVAGGILGAAGKAVWAAGTGDDDILQEAARGLGMGIGVGDKVGQGMVNIPGNIREHRIEKNALNEKIGDYNSKIRELNKSIDEEMKKFNASDI